MDNYNKLFMIIRKTDLLNYDEKNELQLYLMNLKEQVKKQKKVIDKAIKFINSIDLYSHEYALDSIEINELLDILEEVSE
jgi:hypothetical protein|nr:MAG TPA: hypothetical protein [Caudoviricetes sp.]